MVLVLKLFKSEHFKKLCAIKAMVAGCLVMHKQAHPLHLHAQWAWCAGGELQKLIKGYVAPASYTQKFLGRLCLRASSGINEVGPSV